MSKDKKEHLEDEVIRHAVVVFVIMYSIYALFAFGQGMVNALEWALHIRCACAGVIALCVGFYLFCIIVDR